MSTNPPLPRPVEDLDWALSIVEHDTDAVYDSYPELLDRLRLLGLLQAQLARLGRTVAAIEARCAQADWGQGSRGGRVNEIEAGELHAKRAGSYRYTWETRKLLFDLLQYELMNHDTGELPDDDDVWDLVKLVLRFGSWTPRATPLYDDGLYDKKTIENIRHSERLRDTVKVTLSEQEEGNDDGPDQGGDATDALPGPAGGSEDLGGADESRQAAEG